MVIQVSLLEESFELVAPHAEALVHDFYAMLLRDYPAVKPLFQGIVQHEQEKMLLGAITFVVNNLRKPQVLLPALRELGARHVGYGALPSHYPAVGATLIKVLSQRLSGNVLASLPSSHAAASRSWKAGPRRGASLFNMR